MLLQVKLSESKEVQFSQRRNRAMVSEKGSCYDKREGIVLW
jgi:hypothetical protein